MDSLRDYLLEHSVYPDEEFNRAAAARNKLFSRLTKKPNEIIGIYFTTPLDTILQRNAQRTGRALVPEDAVVNMFNSLTRPTLDEGFTEILEVE